MRILRAGVVFLLLAAGARAANKKSTVDVLNRGEQISTAVAAVTSTAISPLLGVCLLGIYDYARAAPEARATLPFYSRPHFWIPIGVLLILIFFKDSIGGTVPLLKKPLDAVEVLIINKAALVLIAFPVMFHQVSKLTGIQDISQLFEPPVVYAASGVEFSTPYIGLAALMLLAGTVIILVVWVVAHTADVVALLSPIPFLDLLVKASRAAVLIAVAGCAVVSPTLGLIASGVVIAICALLFWLALRVLILGTVIAWDVLFAETETPSNDVHAFTVGKIRQLPRITLGKLSRDAGGALEFRYRRMGLGPIHRIRLDEASACEVGRGFLYPCVMSNNTLQLRLLPRYRGAEEAVRAALGMAAVRDSGLGRWVSGIRKAPA